MWLLVGRQNVKEWSRSVTRGSAGGQRSRAAQSRGEVEGRRGASMETLLIERLQEKISKNHTFAIILKDATGIFVYNYLSLIVNGSTDVWHPRIARCYRDT